jgi:hypothetical protein
MFDRKPTGCGRQDRGPETLPPESERTAVQQIIESDFEERMIGLAGEIGCAHYETRARMQSWQAEGKYTIFNAGTFDVLTLNHILGLVQCRSLAAMDTLGIESIENPEDQQAVHRVAASGDLRLMVTLDTNRALEEGKSRKAHKGYAPKPTMDWFTRAAMLASQSMRVPESARGERINLVDYITRHGPECCGSCTDEACVNEDNAAMTVMLQPSLVVINNESEQTVADMSEFKRCGLLPNTRIEIIKEEDNQYMDPILGGPVKTTSIIERIRS